MNCRICDTLLPPPFLDLGNQPLANSYLSSLDEFETEKFYPLQVCFCDTCKLVQLSETISPETIFTDYAYFSSYSSSFLEHAKEYAEDLIQRFALTENDKVIEIGSNDGYLLQYFKNIKVLGIEPSLNLVAQSLQKGIPTLDKFFGLEIVNQILYEFGKADLILGNNVLAHIPNIRDTMQAVSALLRPIGSAVFEFPYLIDLLRNKEFDTIYHEHVFYYSITAIQNLINPLGLEIWDIQHQDVHGGTVRVYIGHTGHHVVSSKVSLYEYTEKEWKYLEEDTYIEFQDSVIELGQSIDNFIFTLFQENKGIAAYGAPAKGNTLLNYCLKAARYVEFTVDLNPYKQGKFLPGSHIPIFEPEFLLKNPPDYTIILPWNIAREITNQWKQYTDNGGKWITFFPTPTVITGPIE